MPRRTSWSTRAKATMPPARAEYPGLRSRVVMRWSSALYMEALVSVDHEIAAWRLAAARGLPFAFRGLGWSMWPILRPGDEAFFAPLAATPRAGDVLLYRSGE